MEEYRYVGPLLHSPIAGSYEAGNGGIGEILEICPCFGTAITSSPPALANDAIGGGASQLNISCQITRTMPAVWQMYRPRAYTFH
jgi:hypothetical protein